MFGVYLTMVAEARLVEIRRLEAANAAIIAYGGVCHAEAGGDAAAFA